MSFPAARLSGGRCGKPHPTVLCLLSVLVLASVQVGCGGGDGPAPAEEEVSGPPDQTYTVRGEVVALPDAKRGSERQLRVRHESIPDFVGFEGEVVGMASMTMPFPLAADVSLEGIEPGEAVEMTFEVRWNGSPPIRIVDLRELPAGTELDFESEAAMPGEGAVEEDGSQPP